MTPQTPRLAIQAIAAALKGQTYVRGTETFDTPWQQWEMTPTPQGLRLSTQLPNKAFIIFTMGELRAYLTPTDDPCNTQVRFYIYPDVTRHGLEITHGSFTLTEPQP